MTLKEYHTIYNSFTDRGYPGPKAFSKTVEAYIDFEHRKQGLRIPNDHSRSKLAAKVEKQYYGLRSAGAPHGEAWRECERLIESQIRGEQRLERRPAAEEYGRARRARRRFSDPFDDDDDFLKDGFMDMDDFARQFDEEMRSAFGGFGFRSEEEGRGYRTESRAPRGSRYEREESRRDDRRGESSRHGREYRERSREPRASSYRTEGRMPGGGTYTYTSTHYSSADPSSSYSNFSDRYGSARDYARSPSPPHGFRGRPRPSHRTYGADYGYDRPQTPPERPMGTKPANDLYQVLGISRTATVDEIKKAHRALSLKWHPDRVKAADKSKATEKMAEINQANDVLSDPKQRQYYDRTGHLPGLGDDY